MRREVKKKKKSTLLVDAKRKLTLIALEVLEEECSCEPSYRSAYGPVVVSMCLVCRIRDILSTGRKQA
jgi:hypothetical protein